MVVGLFLYGDGSPNSLLVRPGNVMVNQPVMFFLCGVAHLSICICSFPFAVGGTPDLVF